MVSRYSKEWEEKGNSGRRLERRDLAEGFWREQELSFREGGQNEIPKGSTQEYVNKSGQKGRRGTWEVGTSRFEPKNQLW